MQNATHLVTGILIQRATGQVRKAWLRHVLVASLGVLSHGILDKIARMTYHPPEPQRNDPFWVVYHAAMYTLSALTTIVYGRRHAPGMFWAAAPDLDWVARSVTGRLPSGPLRWRGPILHTALHKLIDALPGLRRLNRLPDWRSKKEGVLVEAGLLASLVMLILAIEEKE